MQIFSRLIVVGASFCIAITTAAQETESITAGDSRDVAPRGKPHRVALRPPSQMLVSVPMIRDVGSQQHAVDESVELHPKVIPSGALSRHSGVMSQTTLHRSGCAKCTPTKIAPARRVLDRLTSGFDYLFFGVTASGQTGQLSNCDCDGGTSCDASFETVSSEHHSHRQPTWNRGAHVGIQPGELREYFEEQPRSPSIVSGDRIRDGVGDSEGKQSAQRSMGARVSPEIPSVPAVPVPSPEDKGLTPAAKLPGRVPLLPLKNLSRPLPDADQNDQKEKDRSWIPPTNPFEDDPLPRK